MISKIKNSLFTCDSIIYIVFVSFFIVPFFYISFFNFPGTADDLFFATYNTHLSYFDKVIDSYSNYIGRYFNAFFFSIAPKVLMNTWFSRLHPIVDLLLLLFSMRFLIKKTELVSEKQVWKLSLVVFGILLLFLPQINTVYWYSGATVYIYPFSGLILIYSLFVKDYLKGVTIVESLVLCLLILAVCGSNEIFMVFTLYGSIVLSVIKIVRNGSTKYASILYVAVSALGNYLVITSPGSKRRIAGESFRYAEDHLENVLVSILPSTFGLFWDWLFLRGLILVPILITIGPTFLKSSEVKMSKMSFFQIVTFMITLIIGGLFIFYYSFGTESSILPRVLNIYFILFILLLVISGLYLSQVVTYSISGLNRRIFFWGGLITLVVFSSQNWKNVCSDLVENKAEQMQLESLWRFDFIASSLESNIVMPRLTEHPKTFMVPEWGADTEAWTNKHLADYFDKETISVDHSVSVEEYRGGEGPVNDEGRYGGFDLQVDKERNRIILTNIEGDETINFFMHYTPLSQKFLSTDNLGIDFINKDFVWPKGNKKVEINLPDYELKKVLIGQYKGANRLWNKTIYFDKSIYEKIE